MPHVTLQWVATRVGCFLTFALTPHIQAVNYFTKGDLEIGVLWIPSKIPTSPKPPAPAHRANLAR